MTKGESYCHGNQNQTAPGEPHFSVQQRGRLCCCVSRDKGTPRRHGGGPVDTCSHLPAWLNAGVGSAGKRCLGLCEVQGLPCQALHQDSFPEEFLPHNSPIAKLPIWSP